MKDKLLDFYRNKVLNFYKEYNIYINIFIIIVLFLGISLTIYKVINQSDYKELSTDNYIVKYDRSFKISKKKDNYVTLKHKSSKSTLKIEIITLEEENKYKTILDLIDEIMYNISEQNNSYKLISDEKSTFTSYNYDGYKLLYEDNNNQIMISTYKKSDKLIIASFISKTKYFDILIDNVNYIVGNFDALEEKYDISDKVTIDSSNITYSTNDTLDKMIDKNKEYEIANNNYKIEYELPDIFTLSLFNSTSNYFNYWDTKNSIDISINTYIYSYNIYDYLDKDNNSNVYRKYKTYREDDDYLDFKEQLSTFKCDYDVCYIYKNSYKVTAYTYNNLEKEEYKREDETIELIYSLNKNHIFVITISSRDKNITEKLINSIKIKSVSNYSTYVKNEIKDNKRVFELQKYTGYTKDKAKVITVSLSKDYKEINGSNYNLYIERKFVLNYNKDRELYDYEVKYNYSSSSNIDSMLDILHVSFSKPYGEYSYYKSAGTIKSNGKQFKVYEGGYTNLGGIMFTNINRFKYYVNCKALFYKLDDEKYLIIEIKGNGQKISNDIVNQVTNFIAIDKNVD